MKPLVHRKAKRVRRPRPAALRLHITRGDTVRVLSGDDKGKEGKVLDVNPRTGRVKVEGVNVVTKHVKATQNSEGGRIRREAGIHHSKVMLIDPKTGEPTRIRRQKDADGTLERIAVKSGQSIPRNR